MNITLPASAAFVLPKTLSFSFTTELPPGFSMSVTTNDERYLGGRFEIPGRTPDQKLSLGRYPYGFECRAIPGNDATCKIMEFYVPRIFSVASQTHECNPALGIRDKDDVCDIALRVNDERTAGEVRVGNLEGDYPGFAYKAKLGLDFIVCDGSQYIKAMSIDSTGKVLIGNETLEQFIKRIASL